jgi:hypothetical protein
MKVVSCFKPIYLFIVIVCPFLAGCPEHPCDSGIYELCPDGMLPDSGAPDSPGGGETRACALSYSKCSGCDRITKEYGRYQLPSCPEDCPNKAEHMANCKNCLNIYYDASPLCSQRIEDCRPLCNYTKV